MKNYKNLMTIVVFALCSLLISCFAGETKAEGTDAKTHFAQGTEYLDAGNGEGAIAEYTKAIELDPAYAEAYLYRGYVYGELEQFEETIADYTNVIELTPDDAQVYNLRGLAYGELGQTELEIADYTKALELDPTYTVVYYNRGYTYADLQRYEEAIADYTKVAELDPENANIYTARGNVYEKMGQYELAIGDHTKAIELDPNYLDAYNNRAISFYRMKQCDEANSDIRHAQQGGYWPHPGFLLALEEQCPTYILELDDAPDDVVNSSMNDDSPPKDVIHSTVESDGSNLLLTITLKDDVTYYLDGHMASVVSRFHIDTDNDPETGGMLEYFEKNTGFDYVIELMACFENESGATCVGGSTKPATSFFSASDTRQYLQGENTFRAKSVLETGIWQTQQEDLTGNALKAVIPYTQIGVTSGQVVRMVIQEMDANDQARGYSYDMLLTLK